MFDSLHLLQNMSLKEKIGQMFLMDFVGKKDLSEDLIKLNQESLLGGIIFFSGSNVEDLSQLHRLTSKIQSYAPENKFNLPFFITSDQEGGQLSAVYKGNTIFPGNMAMGFANDINMAYKIGNHIGRELKYAGISINFAPVLDVSYDSKEGVPIVDNRMFSSNADIVAQMGTGMIRGLQDAGIIACGKHFPGQRLTERDTHHALDVINYSKERLEKVEFMPFKKAIDAGVGSIMVHHAVYTEFDDKPASLSPVLLNYLRKDLNFQGLIITDDLIMKAVEDHYGNEKSIELAINAGNDLIILSGAKTWGIDFVYDEVKKGIISEDRINESVNRILLAKSKYNIGQIAKKKKFSVKVGNKLAHDVSKKALVKYSEKRNILPLQMKKTDKLGIILANPARLVMSDTVNFYNISLKEIILRKKYHSFVKESIMPWNPTEEEMLSLFDIGFVSDPVIFLSVNAYRFKKQIEVLENIRNDNPDKRIISVATRSPNDVKFLEPYSDVVIATGGMTPFQMEALVDSLFKPFVFLENEAKKL